MVPEGERIQWWQHYLTTHRATILFIAPEDILWMHYVALCFPRFLRFQWLQLCLLVFILCFLPFSFLISTHTSKRDAYNATERHKKAHQVERQIVIPRQIFQERWKVSYVLGGFFFTMAVAEMQNTSLHSWWFQTKHSFSISWPPTWFIIPTEKFVAKKGN